VTSLIGLTFLPVARFFLSLPSGVHSPTATTASSLRQLVPNTLCLARTKHLLHEGSTVGGTNTCRQFKENDILNKY
jgi:hypothetical protein